MPCPCFLLIYVVLILFNERCECLDGFEGDRCEVNIDDCTDHTCQNGATCIDGIQSYSCQCMPGFTG